MTPRKPPEELLKVGRKSDPRIRSYCDRYNVPVHRVRRAGLDHLDAMQEDARAYLLRCTQPQGWRGGKVAVRHGETA